MFVAIWVTVVSALTVAGLLIVLFRVKALAWAQRRYDRSFLPEPPDPTNSPTMGMVIYAGLTWFVMGLYLVAVAPAFGHWGAGRPSR